MTNQMSQISKFELLDKVAAHLGKLHAEVDYVQHENVIDKLASMMLLAADEAGIELSAQDINYFQGQYMFDKELQGRARREQ